MSDFRSFLKNKGSIDKIDTKGFNLAEFNVKDFEAYEIELEKNDTVLAVYFNFKEKPVGIRIFSELDVVKRLNLKVVSSMKSKTPSDGKLRWLVLFEKK